MPLHRGSNGHSFFAMVWASSSGRRAHARCQVLAWRGRAKGSAGMETRPHHLPRLHSWALHSSRSTYFPGSPGLPHSYQNSYPSHAPRVFVVDPCHCSWILESNPGCLLGSTNSSIPMNDVWLLHARQARH
ncbi:hypothetical protein BO82DRAFT_108709 [Aspergillus uvarum CBS 121591]|uniref:Uncharacterized protein n=1 Tax=Aspergillus uvarum CBS 121591 TaxID=1448315 RepID=A0A319C894_9EURO|nr:hypothetical protein BO82DRAFT_108709 [Aspergillus uvarum CBS 121591]PYH80340.1 hypothetical protein BO82DRAFT_108709 [Aspergillus uvarum CBS 121591]